MNRRDLHADPGDRLMRRRTSDANESSDESRLWREERADRGRASDDLGKCVGCDRLRSVAQSVRRIVMNLEDEPMGSGRDGRHRHRRDEFASAGSMAWVDDDGKVRQFFDELVRH